MKRFLIAGICVGLVIATVPSGAVASEKDQALALATSGCYQGLLQPLFPTSDLASYIIHTATIIQLSDYANNELLQIHHNQLSEGWNSAAVLDSKWTKLISTYDNIYLYVGRQLLAGRRVYEAKNGAVKKYGGTITSLCKIAISNSTAKAKAQKISLRQWIIRNAGDLLPPLDLDLRLNLR